MRLASIMLNNFRVFKDSTCFELSPLTVVTGANSSGKSSIFKALLLLQDNLKKNKLAELQFDGIRHRLGSFNSIKNHFSRKNKISFQLVYDSFHFEKSFLLDVDKLNVTYVFSPSIDKDNATAFLTSLTIKIKRRSKKREEEILKINYQKIDRQHCKIKINTKWFFSSLKALKSIKQKGIEENFDFELYPIDRLITAVELSGEIQRQNELLELEFETERAKIHEEAYAKLMGLVGKNKLPKDLQEELQNIEIQSTLAKEKEKEDYLKEIGFIYTYIDEIGKKNSLFEERNKGLLEKEEEDLTEVESKLLTEYYGKNIEREAFITDLESEKRKYFEIIDLIEKRKISDIANKITSWNDTVNTDTYNDLKESMDDLLSKYSLIDIEELGEEYRNMGVKANPTYNDINEYRSYLNERLKELFTNFLINEIKKKVAVLFSRNVQSKFELTFPVRKKSIPSLLDIQNADSDSWKTSLRQKLTLNEELDLENYLLTDIVLKSQIQSKSFLVEHLTGLTLRDVITTDKIEDFFYQTTLDTIEILLNIAFNPIPFEHISSFRGIQQRIYHISLENSEFEDSIWVYHNDIRKRRVKQVFFKEELVRFEIGDDFRTRVIDGSSIVAEVLREGEWTNIADLGFGIVQLIPIIIKIAANLGEKKYLLIEEPGSHLHPNYQSLLADLIVKAIKKDVYFIIETHSEYLIRRLQYLVSEEKINSDKVSIFYLNAINNISEEVSQLERIIIQSDGYIEEEGFKKFWKGFYDEATTLKDKLDESHRKKEEKRLIEELDIARHNLNEHNFNIKCVVLTEDGNAQKKGENYLEVLLKSCGFKTEKEVLIKTYNGGTNKDVWIGLAKFAESLPNVQKIIVHRDADGCHGKYSKKMDGLIRHHKLLKTISFVTYYNDIEGYFVNPEHITTLYEDVPIGELEKQIGKVADRAKEKSLKNLKSNVGDIEQAEIIYASNPEKYIHTKSFVGILKEFLQVKKKPGLLFPSEKLKDDLLVKIAKEIWAGKEQEEN